MFFRTAFPSLLFVVAIVAGAFGALQTWRLAERDQSYSVVSQKLLAATRDAKPTDVNKVRDLTVELAATRQQLSTTETAMTEAEARLAEEISAHAALKAKSANVATALAEAERMAAAAKAEADAARLALQRTAKGVAIETTGSVSPASPDATPATAAAASADVSSPAASAKASTSAADASPVATSRRQVRREQAKAVTRRLPRANSQSPSTWMTPYLR